jgi:hypothetical protein
MMIPAIFQCDPSFTSVVATPDYWMILWLRALRNFDLLLAAEAQRRLRELGVDIGIAQLPVREVTHF